MTAVHFAACKYKHLIQVSVIGLLITLYQILGILPEQVLQVRFSSYFGILKQQKKPYQKDFSKALGVQISFTTQ